MEVQSQIVETIASHDLVEVSQFKQPVSVVAFDFDGTIIDGQSGVELVRYLCGKRILNPARAIKIFLWGIRYKLRLPCQQAEVREDIFSLFKNDPLDQVNQLMTELHDERVVPLYRKDALQLIEQLKQEGCYLLMVSAAFMSLAMPAAERLGFHALLATRMQLTDDGSGFTGKVLGKAVEGEEKTRILYEFCNLKFGEGNWRLRAAYGDHHSDASLLAAAEEAYAVCPDGGLARRARRCSWHIEEWR